MKKIITSLIFLCLAFLNTAYAVDATANGTVTLNISAAVVELIPLEVTLTKKPGVDQATQLTNFNLCSDYKQYFIDIRTAPGYFKITGEPGKTVTVAVTPPSNLGAMTLNSPIYADIVSEIATRGIVYINYATFNMPASGEVYFYWGINSFSMGFCPVISLPNLAASTYRGTATVTVNYQ